VTDLGACNFVTKESEMKGTKGLLGLLALLMIATVVGGLIQGPDVFAQAGTGSIRGLVSDPSGAVLPDVEIEATNLNTQLKFTTKSTAAGIYVMTGLPIGQYKVTAQRSGFKQYLQERLDVATAQQRH
jgi:predicted mannosyl-3-phosphoglycerate phosphatase (HAD superfamily)